MAARNFIISSSVTSGSNSMRNSASKERKSGSSRLSPLPKNDGLGVAKLAQFLRGFCYPSTKFKSTHHMTSIRNRLLGLFDDFSLHFFISQSSSALNYLAFGPVSPTVDINRNSSLLFIVWDCVQVQQVPGPMRPHDSR